MSRLKITYTKHRYLLQSPIWGCTIYDRKTQREYSGGGSTKEEAKEYAFMHYYRQKDGPEPESTLPDSETKTHPAADYILLIILTVMVVLLIWKIFAGIWWLIKQSGQV